MSFRRLAILVALVLAIFGLYLLQNAAYVFWETRGLYYEELVERDSHGMSQLIGYTFMLMFGVVVLGLGLIMWSCRNVIDLKSRRAISLAYFVLGVATFSLSIYLEIAYWQSGWGRVYVLAFLVVTLLAGYFRFVRLPSPDPK